MTAPQARRVDALTGQVASAKFFGALSEADRFCSEVADAERLRDENSALRCKLDELELELAEAGQTRMRLVRENAQLKRQLETWRQSALAATRELEWEQSC